jgi:hypothetical protein
LGTHGAGAMGSAAEANFSSSLGNSSMSAANTLFPLQFKCAGEFLIMFALFLSSFSSFSSFPRDDDEAAFDAVSAAEEDDDSHRKY